MPILLAGLLVAFLVMMLFGGTEFDRGLLLLVHVADDPRLAAAGSLFDQLTSPFALAAMGASGAGFLLVLRQWRGALLLLTITAGIVLLGEYLGSLTSSLRPSPSERALQSQVSLFPNAASAGAAAIWVGLAFLLTRHRPWRSIWTSLAVLLALAVGTLQSLNGLAWPSDVIGGWALGLFWTLLLLWLAGEELGDGTPRPVRHPPLEGEPPDRRQGADPAQPKDRSGERA